ncbi:hypothetical protein R1sor_003429 [Riccia sorocarpa]|uniref:Reverse transcriptase domain-containing protein n=1 Tax=Riccia sorocarpa TaxID=122646 RepID=A0ABD3H4A6_9MARC
MVTETLSAAIEYEVRLGAIQGIYLQRENVHYCLGFFADDSHIIINATREHAYKAKRLLESFAKATGLTIQWAKSTAQWIGPLEEQRPEWTEGLTWSWKAKRELTKLLGFGFEDGIQAEDMLQRCKQKITETCSNQLYDKLSICGRIAVVNSVLLARSKSGGMSRTLENVFKAWETLKRYIHCPKVHTMTDWMQLQLWGSSYMANDGKIRKLVTQAQQRLWEEGYRQLGDLVKEGATELAGWESKKIQGVQQVSMKKAYTAIVGRIQRFQQENITEENVEGFFVDKQREGLCWTWTVSSSKKHKNCTPPTESTPFTCYKIVDGWLNKGEQLEEPTTGAEHEPIAITAFRVGKG